MTLFICAALVLVAIAGGVLLYPLVLGWKPRRWAGNDLTLDILREQMAELERKHQKGRLSDAAFAEDKAELERRLIEEAAGQAAIAAAPQTPPPLQWKTAWIALVILLLALPGYAMLGNPLAADPKSVRQTMGKAPSAAEIGQMVESLEARLKANPDDPAGWAMLARSRKFMGNMAGATEAYAHLEKDPAMTGNAGMLADYAESIALSGNGFKGKPSQLIEQALKLDPENGHAMLLAGAAALEAGDKPKALGYWEKLLPQVPEGDMRQFIVGQVDKLKGELAQPTQATPPAKPEKN
ncbi:MAG: c-type cytochrome biogenesis protein CcmI [Zoogloeaceae bacterium]|jgi:cytochrome c-type biogenesis protein CcmH|nr:c-type cytochrome biogenesis protein CcmI [Zoogloeaceae bacterium]